MQSLQKLLSAKYWTKSKGTGGAIRDRKDFVVDEIPFKKFFSKYTRGRGGVKPMDGPYVLALLKKNNMTTKDAIKLIKRELKISKNDIGYAGLKDKFAVTSQYITIRKEKFREIRADKMELTKISSTDKMMQVGELEGNKFIITLHNCKNPENAKHAVEALRSGMPNYFGSQRFGKYGDNHVIGKLILNREYEDVLNIINKRTKKQYSSINELGKKLLKFFIHAYQSYLFNKALDSYILKNRNPSFVNFPIVGFDTKLKNDFASEQTTKLLKMDKVKQEDFAVRDLNIKCGGSSRAAFVMPKILAYSINGKTLRLEFELPKGSYATILIREIAKLE